MKKIIGSIVLIFVLALIVIQMNKNSGILTSASTAAVNPEAGYCLAIRGNGELEPAHWGGMARTVEKLGLPQAMAGGSSGSSSSRRIRAPVTGVADRMRPHHRAFAQVLDGHLVVHGDHELPDHEAKARQRLHLAVRDHGAAVEVEHGDVRRPADDARGLSALSGRKPP